MRSWLFPPARAGVTRAVEATAQQVLATGAAGAAYGPDPLDEERGWRRAGAGGHREVPWWTLEKARIYSVAAYRANPMARAIIDTYTSFCVGDSGVSFQATNPQVGAVVGEFWSDPRVRLGALQDQMLRDHMLMGETALQLLVGPASGVVRFCPAPISNITDVRLLGGNPLWPHELVFGPSTSNPTVLRVADIDDATGLRDGQVMWWRSWMALLDDLHGDPFLTPILDHLDSYDQVISNLIDRTALARYMVWDVTVEGDDQAVKDFIRERGGRQIPPSGSIEVHNQSVTWEPRTVQTGAEEDSIAGKNVLTLVAGGAGLAKTWLAEPDGANRATSLSMAEPVRRRVGGVQKLWLGYITELCRFAVDRAVAARRLPQMVTARDPRTGATFDIPAAQTVTVTGPSISASDAEFTAKILLNLSTGLEKLVTSGALSKEAARIAARKAWEDYMGIPYTADLDSPDADPGDVATAVDEALEAFDADLHPRDRRGRFRRVISHDVVDGTVAVRKLADRRLGDLAVDFIGEDPPNEAAIGVLDEEDQRRIGEREAAERARQERLDQLIARGRDYLDAYAEVYRVDPERLRRQQINSLIDAERAAGETRAQAVRRAYREFVNLRYLEAERVTRGHLLTREAEARAINPVSLFSGPSARARRWASEELKRFWEGTGGRVTYTEFAGRVMGGDGAELEALRLGGNDRDFGV